MKINALPVMKIFSKASKFFIFLLSDLFSFLITCIKKKDKKLSSLVILKPDALGDYVLFRGFLKQLKKQYSFLIVIANSNNREIAEMFDAGCVDHFLWIDKKKFVSKIFYRTSILAQVRCLSVDTFAYPCFSREGYDVEAISRLVQADKKLAWYGDNQNQSIKLQEWSCRFYDQVFYSYEKVMFEQLRNQEFFSKLLGSKIEEVLPLELNGRDEKTLPYAVIFIGASAKFRQWELERFAKIAEHIDKKYALRIVISGGPENIEQGKILQNMLKFSVDNLVGKTTLTELVGLVGQSDVIVSNETGIPHIAIATKHQNVFVVSNGNHYGRFTPYPKQLSSRYFPIYPPELECLDETERLLQFSEGSTLNINSISAEAVISSIEENIKLS